MIKIMYGPPKSMLQHVVENVTSTLHWVTADGRRVRVTRMEDGHLVSTVRKLRRDATEMLQEEQSDHDYDCGVAREDYLRERVRPYATMLREVKKRGLSAEVAKEPNRAPPRDRGVQARGLAALLSDFPDDDCFDDVWGDS